jgi:hypothetical protein
MARIDQLTKLRGQLQEAIDAIDRMIEAEVAKSKPVWQEKLEIPTSPPRDDNHPGAGNPINPKPL